MSVEPCDKHLETILSLAFVAEFRDADTVGHLRRMSELARLLATAAQVDPATVEVLALAAPMHDVGKVAIPDDILLKPTELTESERREMQSHTLMGERLLAAGPTEVLRLAAAVARSHHERWDGSGYPDGLVGEAIPLPARIVGLADVIDGLVTKRIYKPPVTLGDAAMVLRAGRGEQFDPALVDAFFAVESEVTALYEADMEEGDEDWLT
jgi:putative two-component system response regulator